MCPNRSPNPGKMPQARARLRSAIAALCLASVAVTLLGCAQVIRRPDVMVGTASPGDVDYPLGGSICRLFNLDTPRHGLRCAEKPSEGSASNIESLLSGSIDVGIVLSDDLADAVAGERQFASRGPVADLRVLFAGHADIFTLVVHQGAGIHRLADLRGKRIGIGNPGSRQSAQMDRVMAALGLARSDFADVRDYSPAAQNRAFCAGELDAIVYSVAHPNGLVRDAALTCQGVLVSVNGPAIDRMLSDYREYERTAIPGGTYPVNQADIQTFGVRAVVVTTTRMPDKVAYEITRAVFDNFDVFRMLHPAFEALSVAESIRRTGNAPIHPGAERYYRERGWLPRLPPPSRPS